MTSKLSWDVLLERFVFFALIAAIATCLLAADTDTHRPFRDTKEFHFLFWSGLVSILMGILFFRNGLPNRDYRPFLWLTPLVAVAAFHWIQSLEESPLLSGVEPGFPAKTDFLTRQYLFALGFFVFFLAGWSACFERKTFRLFGLSILVLLTVEVIGVGIEILGTAAGWDWRPFLAGAFVETGAREVKAPFFGSLGNSNFLSGYLVILFFPAFYYSRGIQAPPARWASYGACASCLVIVGLSKSKGALLGLLAGTAASGWLFLKTRRYNMALRPEGFFNGRRKWILVAILVVSLGAVVAGFVIVTASNVWGGDEWAGDWLNAIQLRGESVSNRLLLAYVGVEMWRQSPWLGIGPGEFRLQFLSTLSSILEGPQGASFHDRVDNLKSFEPVHLHNDFLEAWIEWGVVGYASAVGFFLSVILRSFRQPSGLSQIHRGIQGGLTGGVIAGVGYALFEFPFHLPSHLPLLATLTGLAAHASIQGKECETSGFRAIGKLFGMLLLLCGVFLSYQGTRLCVASHLAGGASLLESDSVSEIRPLYERINRARKLDPGNGEFDLLLGQFEWKLEGRSSAARHSFRRAQRISDDPSAYLLEAQMAIEERRYREAERAIEPIQGVTAYLPELGYVEGRIAEGLGNPGKAAEAYSRDIQAANRYPNPSQVHRRLPDLYLRYAAVLESLERYREALRQYENHVESLGEGGSDIPEALLRMGRIYRDRFQDYPSALLYFERALQSAEKHSSLEQERLIREEIRELERLIRKSQEILLEVPEEVDGDENIDTEGEELESQRSED